MARRGKSQARRGGNSDSLPGWAWLLIGVILALVVVLLAPKYLTSDRSDDGFFRPRPNPDARPAISALDEVPPRSPQASTPTPRPLPAPARVSDPEYDFYTVLPDEETALTDAEVAARARAEAERQASAQPRPAPPPAATATTTPAPVTHPDAAAPATSATTAAPPAARPASDGNSRYLLQAGAFSNPADAEALKAQIALLGLQARIEPGTVDGKAVHRVRLGPYASASELTDIKQRLGNGGLSALAVRVE